MEGEEQVGTAPISEAPVAGEQLPVAAKDGEAAGVELPAAVEGAEARAASPVDAASDGVVVLSGVDSPGGANTNTNAATQEEEEVVTLQEPIPSLTWFQYYFAYADPLDVLMMLLGTVGGIVTGALIPYFQFLFGKMLDSLNSGENLVQAVNKVAIEFGYISVVAFVGGVCQVLGWGVNGERQVARIRGLYVKGILRQDIAWFDLQTRGQTATIVADLTATLQDGMGRKNGDVIEYVTQFVGGFVIAFMQSWKLTLVLLCAIPAVAWATAMLAMLTARAQKKGSMAYAAAGSKAYEALASIRTVQALRLQDRVMAGYTRLLKDAELMGYQKARDNGLGIGLIGLVVYATFGLGFWYGSMLVADSVGCRVTDASCMSGGKVLSTFFAVIMGAMGLGSAFPCLSAIVQGKSAAERIVYTITRTPLIDSASDEGTKLKSARGEIELKDVEFAYPTRPHKAILRGYSLRVEAGQTLALVGPSGEGKSTIMSLLLRFYDPACGSVCLDGQDFRSLNLASLRDHIGYVGQEPVLLGGTIRENIVHGKKGASDEEVVSAARMANAHDFISAFEKGYDTFCGEGGAQLSGGQKQRIAIARALIKDPAILLLDEATSALDNKAEKEVQAALDRLQEYKRRTTIVIAHRLTTIRNADKIAFVKGGKVLELGSHVELMDAKGLYHAMVQAHEHEPTPEDLPEDLPDDTTTAPGEMAASGAGGGPSSSNTNTNSNSNSNSLLRKTSLGLLAPSGTRRLSKAMSKASSMDDSRRSSVDFSIRRKSSLLAVLTPVPDIEMGEGDGAPVDARVMLWKLAIEEWDAFLVGLLGSIVNGAGFPVLGFLIARSQDTLYLRNPVRIRSQGEFWGGMFCLLGVVIFIARLAQEYGLGVMSERLARKLRIKAFGSMLRKRIAWFDKEENSTGSLTTQLSEDASRVNGVLGTSLGQLLQLIFCLSIALGLAFSASWQMALLVLGTLPLQVIGRIVQQSQMTGTQGQDSKDTGGSAGAVLSTAVLGIRTVAAFNLQDTAHDRYQQLYDATLQTRLREAIRGGLLLGYTQVVQYGTNGLTFYVAGQLMDSGEDSFKDIMQAIMTLMLGTSGVAMALKGLGDSRGASEGARRIATLIYSSENQTIDCMSELGDKPSSYQGNIELRNIEFTYPNRPNQKIYGGPTFPHGYSLKIKAGETVALVGPSGGGKSTTMQLILRFYDPQVGKVLFDGVDVRNLNVKWLRSQISYVGQEPALFAGTVFDNIMNGNPGANEEAVTEAARAANIHDFIMTLPNQYRTMVDEGSINLSGGQKQRIALARAFIGDPRILLLDEATSALDNENERKVMEAVEHMQKIKKFTTLIIAHRLSTIQKSDRIAVISGGGVVEIGNHSELLAMNGVYAQLCKQGQGKPTAAK